jgi:hypothetical protein
MSGMNAVNPVRKRPNLGSHSTEFRYRPQQSRVFNRGVLGDKIDGRSREGRFLIRCEAELIADIGGEPSFAQKMLIRRCARGMLRLELLDEKMAAGNWTDHDARTFGGLTNAVRLMLRELGVKAEAAREEPRASLRQQLLREAKRG